jgi:hypothetical protein
MVPVFEAGGEMIQDYGNTSAPTRRSHRRAEPRRFGGRLEHAAQLVEEQNEPGLILVGHACKAMREDVNEAFSPLGEQLHGLRCGKDEDAAPVRGVRLAAEKPDPREGINRAACSRIRRSHPGGERTKAKRGLIHGDRERESLCPRKRTIVGLLEPALANQK